MRSARHPFFSTIDGVTISCVQLNLTNFHGHGRDLIGFINYACTVFSGQKQRLVPSNSEMQARSTGIRVAGLRSRLSAIARSHSSRVSFAAVSFCAPRSAKSREYTQRTIEARLLGRSSRYAPRESTAGRPCTKRCGGQCVPIFRIW